MILQEIFCLFSNYQIRKNLAYEPCQLISKDILWKEINLSEFAQKCCRLQQIQ